MGHPTIPGHAGSSGCPAGAARGGQYARLMPRQLRIAIVGPTHPFFRRIATHTTSLAIGCGTPGTWCTCCRGRRCTRPSCGEGTTRVPEGRARGRAVPRLDGAARLVRPVLVDPRRPVHATGRRRGRHRGDAVPRGALRVMRVAAGRRPRGVVLAHNVLPHEHGRFDEALVRFMYRQYGPSSCKVTNRRGWRAGSSAPTRPSTSGSPACRSPTSSWADDADADAGADAEAVPTRSRCRLGKRCRRGRGCRTRGWAHHGRAAPRRSRHRRLLRHGPPVQGRRPAHRRSARVPGSHSWSAASSGSRSRSTASRSAPSASRTAWRSSTDTWRWPTWPGSSAASTSSRCPTGPGRRRSTSSLAHRFGAPVLVSDAGTLALDVQDGVDGLVVPADDVDALAVALERLTQPGGLDRLRAGVDQHGSDRMWQAYTDTVASFADRG